MGLGKNYLQIKGREKENNSSDNNLLQAGCSRSNASLFTSMDNTKSTLMLFVRKNSTTKHYFST